MIRDAVRAALVVAVAAALASIVVEARQRLAIIDLAHRATAVGQPIAAMPPQAGQPGYGQPEAGPLRRFGRATLDLADAAIGIVR
jgi:hypothetical protein